MALTAAYVGTLSRDVPTMVDGNYAPYVPGIANESSGSSGATGYNTRRPYDQNATGTGTLGQNIFLSPTRQPRTIRCRSRRAGRFRAM